MPLDKDEIVRLIDGQYQKLIWGKPSRLFKKDEQKWEGFKQYIKENKLTFPESYYMDEDSRVGYRFMQSCYWNN